MRLLRYSLFILLALCWTLGAAAQSVTLTLTPMAGVGAQGGRIFYSATITNHTGQAVVLNQIDPAFSDPAPLFADPTAFYLNFAGTLADGASISGLLFEVDADLIISPGVYHGTVALLGGASGSSLDNLAQTDFQTIIVHQTTPPTTIIKSGPTESSIDCYNTATFTLSGTDQYTQPADLLYQSTFDGGALQGPTASTSVTFNNLTDGPHTFTVAAINAAGIVDPNPIVRHFTVDTVVPTISNVAAVQVQDAAAGITWNTNKPTNSRVQYRVVGAALWNTTTTDTTLRLGHGVAIYGLTPLTTYEYQAISDDLCLREATSAIGTFTTTADTTPPQTALISGPNDGASVRPGAVVFAWTGVDDATQTSDLLYQYSLDGAAFSAPAATTTVTYNFPNNGTHSFAVRAVDKAGNTDPNPPTVHFMVDGIPPVFLITSATNLTFNSAQINWTTDKPTTGTVQYIYDDGSAYTTVLSFPYYALTTNHALVIGPLGFSKAYKARIIAQDAAGNQTVSDDIHFTTGPLHDLSVTEADLSFSNPAPATGNAITMSAKIHNTGNVDETATVNFYDSSAAGTVQVGSAVVTIPAFAAMEPTVTSPPFTVGEGSHRPFVQIVNAAPAEDITYNNFAGRSLTVGGPPCRVSLGVSNPKTFPGDNSLFTVNVTNTGSQAVSLAGLTLNGPSWITLAPGTVLPPALAPSASAQITYQVQTPANVTGGPFNNPVLLPLTLTLNCPTQTFSANFSAEVYSQPVNNIDLTVLDDASSQPISGATVALDGSNKQYFTGPAGKPIDNTGAIIKIPAPAGAPNVYAIANNYLPAGGSIDPTKPVVLRLKQGQPLQITAVTLTPLTVAQIQQRGVNLADPANYYVVDFEIRIKIGPLPVPNVILPLHPTAGGFVSGSAYYGGGGGGGYTVGYTIYYPTPDPTIHTDTWIIIPGDIRILKQFWDATVFVKNNSAFNINNVQCTLTIPSGLALPDLFNRTQSATQSLGTIAPMSQKQASYVVRGDVPGTYNVTGSATGDLQLGGSSVPVSATLQSLPITVAEPKIGLTFHTPSVGTVFHIGDLFTIGIDVANLSTIDLQLVIAEIKKDKLVNCHLAPGEPAAKLVGSDGSIPLGQTRSVSFNFISEVNGTVEAVETYVSAPTINPPVTVKPLPILPPVAHDDSATTTVAAPVTIDALANDFDVNNSPLFILSVATPANGSASIVNNKIVYTPKAGFTGTDTFQYTITDANPGNTASANISVTVLENPAATISRLSPAQVNAGGGAVTIVITGTGFIPSSQVILGGQTMASTYISPTQLTVFVPANLTALAKQYAVIVTNPAPGGGFTNFAYFTVNGSPRIVITAATATRQPNGTVKVNFTLTNTGTKIANLLNLTSARLTGINGATATLNLSQTSLSPNATYNGSIIFPATVTAATRLLQIYGSITGSSLSLNYTINIP